MYCARCGTKQPDSYTFCDKCGMRLVVPKQEFVHRQGAKLVVPRGAMLPAVCVKCGRMPADGTVKENLTWHHPAIYFLILAGVLAYGIVATILSKKMEVQVPICEFHRQRRMRFRRVGIGLQLGCIPIAWAVGSVLDDGIAWGLLVFLALLIAGGVVFDSGRLLKPASIDAQRGVFKGTHEAFLAQLPAATS